MAAPLHRHFLTRGPHEGVPSRSASRNGYGYVEGNPTNWVDLSGLCASGVPITLETARELGLTKLSPPTYRGLPPQSHVCADPNELQAAVERRRADDRQALRELADKFAQCLAQPSSCQLATCSAPDCRPQDAPDALGKLVEYLHQRRPDTTSVQIINDISLVLLGTEGDQTVLRAASNNYNTHPLARSSEKFHADYWQADGQVYHFWAFFTTAANGGLGLATLADIVHECYGFPNNEGSVQDARLSTLALRMGAEAHKMAPQELADTLRRSLRSGFSGDLLPHYYAEISIPLVGGFPVPEVLFCAKFPIGGCLEIGRTERQGRTP